MSGQYGIGGSGGFVTNAQPIFSNPTTFIFLNGNNGATGSGSSGAPTNYGYGNVGYGDGGAATGSTNSAGTASGGAGGAGGYIQIIYAGGQIPPGTLLNYIIGQGGVGSGANGANGAVRITWA